MEERSEASSYLLEMAAYNAHVYASQLQARAVIVTGSAAEGVCDFYSDLDMIVYYDTLPSEEELLQACQHNQGQERKLMGPRGEDEVGETYLVRGVECQFGHTTIKAWERDIATVLERLDVTSPLQKALSGMLDALPLHGKQLVRDWQARLALYPTSLAEAMVRHYLTFFPLWGLQERLASRDATIWTYQILVETAQSLLGVLAGLNRRYYSSFQFKRTRRFVAQLPIAPVQFADRLEAIFHSAPLTSVLQVEALVQETVALVELHMPQIGTTRVRGRIGWRQPAWQA